MKPAREWRSPLLRDHPLVGKIVDVGRGALSTESQLFEAARGARYLLLGEQHDNADHHALQALLVGEALSDGRPRAVAFEMFDVTDQPAIDAYLEAHPRDPFGVGAAARWSKKGWPSWQMYAPIVEVAVRARAGVVAANLARGEVMGAAKSGRVSIGGEARPLPELPSEQVEAMKEEMYHAHCEHVPKEMMGMMAMAQIARDVSLAHHMVDAGRATILIAGNGHTRTDRGVPWHLRERGVEGSIVSVGLVEVREREEDPMRYGDGGGRPPYDFVWFTPGWNRGDPCAGFGEGR